MLSSSRNETGRPDKAERPAAYGLDCEIAGTFVACVGDGPTRLPPARAAPSSARTNQPRASSWIQARGSVIRRSTSAEHCRTSRSSTSGST